MQKQQQTEQNTPTSASRRGFLGTGGAAAAAAALPIELSAQVAGSDQVKVGLIGMGGRGSGAVVQNLAGNDRARLVAVADAFADKIDGSGPRGSGLPAISQQLEKLGKSEQVDLPASRQYTGFDAYKQVVDEVDLVCIATPTVFRPIHFEYAVNQGKHVFMEKPVCVDAWGFNKIIESAQKADDKGLKVVVGLQRHYQESYLQSFAKMHEEGMLGELLGGQCYWNGARPWQVLRQDEWSEMEYQVRNWGYFNWLSGDHNVEQHIHNYDVMNWFLSGDSARGANPVSAQGLGGRASGEDPSIGNVFDHHYVEYRYDQSMNNAIVNSQCRQIQGAWRQVGEEIIGTEATLKMNGSNSKIIDRKGETIWSYRKPRTGGTNPYFVEHAELHKAIAEDLPLNDAYYGAKSSMTGVIGRIATYTGQVVSWDEAVNSNFNLMPENFSLEAEPTVKPDSNGHYPIAIPGQTKFPWA